MQLEGRTALVTGASRGIGAAIARTFAREGARIVITGRGEPVEAVAADIRAAGGAASAIRGDLVDDSFVKRLVQHCRQEVGSLDILVNNAGIMRAGVLGMTSLAAIREMFEINGIALMNLSQYAIRIMDGARFPSIINLASVAGTRGLEGLTAYSASKGAVVAFTRASALELAARGIRVNALAPGMIDTELLSALPTDAAQQIAGIRMARLGTADEVASAALYLASDASRYVTGQVLELDGGMRG